VSVATDTTYRRQGKPIRPSGNVVPMREVPDDEPTRASGALPLEAWELLDLAKAAGLPARLTWCVGWTAVLEPDGSGELTPTGKPKRAEVDRHVHSLVLRVRGLLWVGWEHVVREGGGAGCAWVSVRGQILGADRIVRQCTHTAAKRALKASAS
jgi:hypothetical protein